MDLKSGSRESGAGGVYPPLAVATLNSGLLNLMEADIAGIFGICWANRGGARVMVDIATCK